jgi:hypothetical protein
VGRQVRRKNVASFLTPMRVCVCHSLGRRTRYCHADTHVNCDISGNKRSVFYIWINRHITYIFDQNNKKLWEELIACFPWYDTGHIKNDASSNYSIVACVLVTAVTFLRSQCLATIGGFLLSRCLATIRGLLPRRCLAAIRELQRHTHAHSYTHRQQRDIISLLYIFFSK